MVGNFPHRQLIHAVSFILHFSTRVWLQDSSLPTSRRHAVTWRVSAMHQKGKFAEVHLPFFGKVQTMVRPCSICTAISWWIFTAGITNFDNFGLAMLTVFQVSAVDSVWLYSVLWGGPYFIVYNHGRVDNDNVLGETGSFPCMTRFYGNFLFHRWTILWEICGLGYISSAWSSWALFLSSISYWECLVGRRGLEKYFLSTSLLNEFCSEFSKERDKAQKSGAFRKNREQQMIDAALRGYLDWITHAELVEEEEFGEDGSERDSNGPTLRRRPTIKDKQDPENESEGKSKWYDMEKIRNLRRMIRRSRRACRKVIKSEAFYWIVIVLVFLNTCVLATEHHGQSEWIADFQSKCCRFSSTWRVYRLLVAAYCNLFFVILFTLEMLFKMFCLGFQGYFVSLFNRFDCFVVISSIVEFVLTGTKVMPALGLSVLRSVRLLRVFKVTRYWNSLRNLVTSLLNSIRSIVSLLLLLFLFILIFALLGMQLFGGKLSQEGETEPYRSNFDSFWQALLTVFQVCAVPSIPFFGLGCTDK